jgi:transcriptional regulator with XRE-family HTH domain
MAKLNMEIGQRIKNLRKQLGLSQDEFGAKLKIHGRQLGHYEIGQALPTIAVLARIADFCEVSLDHLYYGQDKKLAKRTQIADAELLDLCRRSDRLPKPQREKVKWVLKGVLDREGQGVEA